MEQKFERRKGKPTPPVGREFHARQGGRAKVLLIPLKDVLLCLLHKDQFLKLTNSCCFHTLHEHLPSPVCAHCVCVCVCRLETAGVCVCVCAHARAEYSRVQSRHLTLALLQVGVFRPHAPLPYSLAYCAPGRFFSFYKSSLGCLLSFHLDEKKIFFFPQELREEHFF